MLLTHIHCRELSDQGTFGFVPLHSRCDSVRLFELLESTLNLSGCEVSSSLSSSSPLTSTQHQKQPSPSLTTKLLLSLLLLGKTNASDSRLPSALLSYVRAVLRGFCCVWCCCLPNLSSDGNLRVGSLTSKLEGVCVVATNNNFDIFLIS